MENSPRKIIRKIAGKIIRQTLCLMESAKRKLFFRKALLSKTKIGSKGNRYDYFLIWGHGLKYKKEILNMIRKSDFLEVKKIMFYRIKNMEKFVSKIVYGHDYAPFWHLKAKTKYLMNVNPNSCIIFVLNKSPKEALLGEGFFKHIECLKIKKLKNEIRDKFNPRKSGLRTEDHIVHASDNEFQTDYLMKSLGYSDGIKVFEKTPNPFLSLPYYIPQFDCFKIKKVRLSQIYVRVLKGDADNHYTEILPLKESPHYKYLMGEKTAYKNYLDNFGGYFLTEDYSPEKFNNLLKNSSYLEQPHDNSYILTEELSSQKYVILDGVHRAAKLLHLKEEEIILAVKEPVKKSIWT